MLVIITYLLGAGAIAYMTDTNEYLKPTPPLLCSASCELWSSQIPILLASPRHEPSMSLAGHQQPGVSGLTERAQHGAGQSF